MQAPQFNNENGLTQLEKVMNRMIPLMEVPQQNAFKVIAQEQQPKLSEQELIAFFNDGNVNYNKTNVSKIKAYQNYVSPNSDGLRQQFKVWLNYMEVIQNSLDSNKYNMILKEQFLRTFGDPTEVTQLQINRQNKKNEKMSQRMEQPQTIGGRQVYQDSQNGYYYKKVGNNFVLIGKGDIKDFDKYSPEYGQYKQLIISNNQKQNAKRSLKTNEQIERSMSKKKNKNIYLQQNQLKKYRQQYYSGDMDIKTYQQQGKNQYQQEQANEMQRKFNELKNAGTISNDAKNKIIGKRQVRYQKTLAIRRTGKDKYQK